MGESRLIRQLLRPASRNHASIADAAVTRQPATGGQPRPLPATRYALSLPSAVCSPVSPTPSSGRAAIAATPSRGVGVARRRSAGLELIFGWCDTCCLQTRGEWTAAPADWRGGAATRFSAATGELA